MWHGMAWRGVLLRALFYGLDDNAVVTGLFEG